MTGQNGVLTQDQKIQADLDTSLRGYANVRTALGLPVDVNNYSPQVGKETMAAHARLVNSVQGPYTAEGRVNEIYRRISGNLPASDKAKMDADPQLKQAFMQVFMGAQTYITFLDNYQAAVNGPGATMSSTSTTTPTSYSQAQITTVLNAMKLVAPGNAPQTMNQQTTKAAIDTLRANAVDIGRSLKLDAAQMTDARLGQAILDKVAAERTQFLRGNPDRPASEFKALMDQKYGIKDLEAVSRVGNAMKSVAASGAFSVVPGASSQPQIRQPAQEIVPDQQTKLAMDRIRNEVFPALDIRPSGTDNAAFRRDFATMSQKMAQMFNLSGDPNSEAVRNQIRTKLNELANKPGLSTLKDLASLPIGGAAAFKTAIVSQEGQAAYDRLPQAVKDDPKKLFTLLDNRQALFGSLDRVYASRVLEQPTVAVARTDNNAGANGGAQNNGGGQQNPGAGGDNTAAQTQEDPALTQAKQLEPFVLALAGGLGVNVGQGITADTASQIQAALQKDRADYAARNASPTDQGYIQNLAFRTNLEGLDAAKLNGIVQASVILSQDAATRAAAANTAAQNNANAAPTAEQIRGASLVVETALMKLGGVANNLGGGALGGLNISALAGFKPPTQADGEFDAQSQDALHMVIMGLKKLGGDKKADGSYSAAVGQKMMADILTKPEFAMVREQYGIKGTYTAAQVSNINTFMSKAGQTDGVSQEDKDKVAELHMLFESLNVLERANKLNNEKGRETTFMGTVMEKIGEFLPESFKNFLRNFFENDKFGKMIGGVLAMFGFPVHKLWGGKAPGAEQVREQVRDGYRRELEEAGFDHAELKRRILNKMDDSLAFKAAERLLFHGVDRGTVRKEVEAALDKAALEANPDRAADVFAEELVRRGEQFQKLTPEQREEYVRKAREAYEQDVRTMPGVPTSGPVGSGQDNQNVRTATGVPNYSADQIKAVSEAMTLAGMSVPAAGLTAAGAKIGIDDLVAKTTGVASALGVDVSTAAYDTLGRRVEEKLADERKKFFGENADATEGQFKAHMAAKGVADLDAASKYAQAFRNVQASGAMNLGVSSSVSVARTTENTAQAVAAADGVTVEAEGKKFEIVFNPNNAQFVQGPLRYSHGRVGALQDMLSQNSKALELSTVPAEYMKGPGGKATDTMTRNTAMALEELLVRAQIAKGTEVSAISHTYDEKTIPVVAEYMRGKGMNEQDIKKFTDTVSDLRADMKSTDPRNRNAGSVQPHSVWDQSYIRNQVDVKVSAVPARPSQEVPASGAGTGQNANAGDRYPGIKMSGQNELPPGMTAEEIFDRYKKFNADKGDPNCAPLVFEHQGKAYAGVVEKASNTFRVVELEGYLDPKAQSYRALSNSDYTLLRDNYNWRNGSPAGIIAYVDKQLCLEPLTVTAEVKSSQPEVRVETARPSVTENFNNRSGSVPRSYWDLPQLTSRDLEGLDKGCLNARELAFLYDRAVATREIPKGGALLTPLNAEDKARLGGDMIISVYNNNTRALEHRLVDFERDKIKIGPLTERYSPAASVRRLDDFLGTQYDAMAMTVSADAVGGRVSDGYRKNHAHTVEDALKHLYGMENSGNGYYNSRRAEYIRGTGTNGDDGFQARERQKSIADSGGQGWSNYSYRPTAEHDHAACNGEFNGRARRAGNRDDNDGFYQPKHLPAAWGSGINTMTDFFGVLRHKMGRNDDEIAQNTRDCGVSSRYDPVETYEVPIGGPRGDRTPGVVDPPR